MEDEGEDNTKICSQEGYENRRMMIEEEGENETDVKDDKEVADDKQLHGREEERRC